MHQKLFRILGAPIIFSFPRNWEGLSEVRGRVSQEVMGEGVVIDILREGTILWFGEVIVLERE